MSGKITTKNEHQFLGRMLQNTDKYENYQETSTSVLGPDVAEHREVRKLPGNIDFSSWAGCCRTPKSTKITTKNEHQFLCRMLQNTEKCENYQEKWTSVLGPDVAAPKTKHYENLQTKPVLDPFKSTADTRKVRELPRKMKIEEVEEPETMKIYRQNPCASARPPRKLRKFTDETNMQARNHENSDEIRPTPVRHLDLATPAFYYYRKNPKCYHTVWGKIWVHSPAANGCNNKKSGAFVALFFTVLGNLGWAWRYLEKVSRENFLQLECTRLCFSGANLHWWNDSPTILHKNQAMSPTSCWMLWPSSSSLISTTCSTRHLLRNHAIMPGTGGTAPFELGSYLQGLRSMMINDWISAVFCAIWHWIATYPPEV